MRIMQRHIHMIQHLRNLCVCTLAYAGHTCRPSAMGGPFLIILCVCIVPYDIICVSVREVGWIDPPGGPDGHGRSHSQPVGGGYRELLFVCHCNSEIFWCVSAGPYSAPSEVSTWFTRQHHFVYRSDRLEGVGK